MKIRSAQLRKLIRELASLNEVEYDEHGPLYAQPDPSGEPTPDEDEVLVRGYGGLKIRQVKKGVSDRLRWLVQGYRRKADNLEPLIALADAGAYEQLLDEVGDDEDPSGVIQAFVKTLVDHNYG